MAFSFNALRIRKFTGLRQRLGRPDGAPESFAGNAAAIMIGIRRNHGAIELSRKNAGGATGKVPIHDPALRAQGLHDLLDRMVSNTANARRA